MATRAQIDACRILLALTIVTVCLPLLGGGTALADVIYVPTDYPTIQEGINAAVDGDEVVILDGMYTGAGNKNLDFGGRLITVRSENGPDNCIIDCQKNGRGFYFHSGETAEAVVEGLTITNGLMESSGGGGVYCEDSSPTLTDCAITGNTAEEGGAGVYCGYSSNATLANCTITGNTADSRGGGLSCIYSSPVLTDCTIEENTTVGWSDDGGGVYCDESSPTFTNCTISGNSTLGDGAGVYCLNNSSPTLTGCMISDNTADADFGEGGGVYCREFSNPTLIDCTINGNMAKSRGAGLFCKEYSSPTLTDCTISGSSTLGSGSGVYCWDNSSPTLTGCTIADNRANSEFGEGGGVYCREYSSPMLTDCTISGNEAFGGGGGLSCDTYSSPMLLNCRIADNEIGWIGGGGVYCSHSNATLINCTVTGNTSSRGDGGGVYCGPNSSAMLSNCTITGNTVEEGYGGGVVCRSSDPTLTNCMISGNTATDGGGGVYCRSISHPVLANCTIVGNAADTDGGGLYCEESSPTLTNCTIVGNTGDGGVYCDDSDPILTNCIIWNDGPQEIYVESGDPMIAYCDVQGGWEGEGNIDADPLFVDPDNGDFHIAAGSPCIDAANNSAVPEDVMTDKDGFPRFIDDPGTADTGLGDPPVVDMGAYEYQADALYVPSVYPTIQAAIDAAADDDLIAVAPGTYLETIDFLGKAIWLLSTDGPETTVIDGQGLGSVVVCNGGEGPGSLLRGFTVTGGSADLGGGIYLAGSSPTIINCLVTENSAANGGGGLYVGSGSAEISDCSIISNYAAERGGGLYVTDGSPMVRDCVFRSNESGYEGMTGGGGGAVHSETAQPAFVECVFERNSTFTFGGAFNFVSSSPKIINCRIQGNTAEKSGGLAQSESDSLIVNCTFVGNSATVHAGAIGSHKSNPTITNCTLTANYASSVGGLRINNDPAEGETRLTNCVLWGNVDDSGTGEDAQIGLLWATPELLVINYSNVQGWTGEYGGVGNIGGDPRFQREPDAGPDGIWGTDDDDYGDLLIFALSPCIDAADNTAVPADEFDLDEDEDTAERIPIEVGGLGRFHDDPGIEDTGIGDAPIVDMGAREFQGESPHLCPGDVNSDGVVDVADLLFVLALWGESGTVADVNQDGIVDVQDLLIVLSGWGPCP